jgi:hypothetical protein
MPVASISDVNEKKLNLGTYVIWCTSQWKQSNGATHGVATGHDREDRQRLPATQAPKSEALKMTVNYAVHQFARVPARARARTWIFGYARQEVERDQLVLQLARNLSKRRLVQVLQNQKADLLSIHANRRHSKSLPTYNVSS